MKLNGSYEKRKGLENIRRIKFRYARPLLLWKIIDQNVANTNKSYFFQIKTKHFARKEGMFVDKS